MARRFQEITEVYRQEIAALARADRWTAFLRSACRNYKLPFEEQVLVHAQRPDATAVLEIERWNRQFGRWVNKGATGIAVFDRDYPGRTRLKYYFDISDTHESRLSRPVPLWQVPAEQEPDVIEALENRFGALDDKGTLEEAIVSAMENAAADNMTDYLDDLQNCRDNSLLEELDELNLSVLYRRLLENSTAYMLMCRCGLEPDEYFDPEDFSEVFNFNTPETLNALGVATRDIAESGLSAIALTVRSRQKQIRTIAQAPGNEYPIDKQTETQTERSENHGTDIHDEGRLPDLLPPQEPETALGKYGLLRRRYLKEHRKVLFTNLLTSGRLNEHLAEIDRTARQRVEQTVTAMAQAEGVTEELKAADPMKWVGLMNNLRNAAEGTVLAELIYS